MIGNISQKEKAERFRQLHYTGSILMLPNIWDPLGALLLENIGYPAVATASASVAFSNGYNDGENIPFSNLLLLLKRITGSVSVPVTADIEKGYAASDSQLQENIRLLIDAGITGINIEDTESKTMDLVPVDLQYDKIRLIRKVSDEAGVPIFINARTDVYLPGRNISADAKTEEAIKRGLAYKEAGADGFYPIALTQEEEIKKIIAAVELPLNIITIPGIPDLKTLEKLGVARVSLGPSFLKIAIRSMKQLALELKDKEGLLMITGNEITSDYLKSLVNRNW